LISTFILSRIEFDPLIEGLMLIHLLFRIELEPLIVGFNVNLRIFKNWLYLNFLLWFFLCRFLLWSSIQMKLVNSMNFEDINVMCDRIQISTHWWIWSWPILSRVNCDPDPFTHKALKLIHNARFYLIPDLSSRKRILIPSHVRT